MAKDMQQWLESGEYLPHFMRDFHDQKDVFKAMYFKQECNSDINWIDGQIYTIDFFLWFMGKRGYTLQKCRKNFVFKDIIDDIKEFKQHQLNTANKIFS